MDRPKEPDVTAKVSEKELEALIQDVVRAQLGADAVAIEWLLGALGCRRFARVWLDRGARLDHGARELQTTPRTLIARVEAPEDSEGRPAGAAPEPPLEPIRALLESEGLPVPKHFGANDGWGVELLEDLGDRALVDVASSLSASELESHYSEACSLVARLQRIEPQPGIAAFGRRLDAALFHYKAGRFARWSLRSEGGGADSTTTKVVENAFAMIAEEMQAAPLRLAHRDLQSANLHLVKRTRTSSASPGESHLVMIDLQGAFMAPPEYDLVCLLRDSYIELEDRVVAAQLERIRPQLPDAPEAEVFQQRFDLLTLTRKAKDHALFLYAATERNDPRYLRFLPATQRYLEAAAARVAAKDPRYRDFAELVSSMPKPVSVSTAEPACAP
jgi:aminoglycoside/choline kinase family phosphotransferase